MGNKLQTTGNEAETVDIRAQIEETVEAKYALDLREMERKHQYELLKVEARAKVMGVAVQENWLRLNRIILMRHIKDELMKHGQWTHWCDEVGISLTHFDREIEKLGDFGDRVLLQFAEFYGYQINKIKYLTSGDLRKSEVTIGNNQILVKGKPVPLTQEDMQDVVDKLEKDFKLQEEKTAKEREGFEAEQKATQKELKKATGDLKTLKGRAEANGRSIEEEGFFQQMATIKKDFDDLLVRMKPEYSKKLADEGISEAAALEYKGTITHIKERILALELGLTI